MLDEDAGADAGHRGETALHDLLLSLHETAAAELGHFRRDGAVHLRGRSALFGREGEYAKLVELRGADEVEEVLEVGLGLAGEADDEGGAQGDTWDGGAEAADDGADVAHCVGAAHGA